MYPSWHPLRNFARITAFLGTLVATSACVGLAEGQSTIKVSQSAPDIALTDQHNQSVSLRAFTGRQSVLVVFYRGHW